MTEAPKKLSKEELRKAAVAKAQHQLTELADKVKGKSDDILWRDHKLHQVHIDMIREHAARLGTKKALTLTDGHIECFAKLHARLCPPKAAPAAKPKA